MPFGLRHLDLMLHTSLLGISSQGTGQVFASLSRLRVIYTPNRNRAHAFTANRSNSLPSGAAIGQEMISYRTSVVSWSA
jgi:hypothetical protein